MQLLTSSQVWAGYDPEAEDLRAVLLEENENVKKYSYLVLTAEDGEAIAEIDVHCPKFDSKKTVLLVGEFDRLPQNDVVLDLTDRGYVVCVVDYSAIKENTFTAFPQSLGYGVFKNAGEHIVKVCPTAKETCQFLYSKVLRRAITFINKELNQKEIALVGMKTGVEIAMQVAGMDKRILAVACICGAGYNEYLARPKYEYEGGEGIDDELMAWLTGVAGIAYAKQIKVPSLVVTGSNGRMSDIDRLTNLMSVMADSDMRISISPRYVDNINKKSYDTFIKWLEGVFLYSLLPELPTLSLTVNNEGAIYASIKTDSCIKVEKVKVYYSYGDNNHSTRNWARVNGETIGEGEYLAKLSVCDETAPFFAFCQVAYKNGVVLSGVVNHIDLGDYKILPEQKQVSPIVFQYALKQGNFTEISKDAVILSDSIGENTLPVGLKGMRCENGSMIIFFTVKEMDVEDSKLLQIDTYNEQQSYDLSISIICGKLVTKEYRYEKKMTGSDSYNSVRLSPHDFKDKDFLPLESWEDLKGVIIDNKNITVGKIMFI